MTMHLSVINARTGTLRWASAGHDPALIYDPRTDRFEEIDKAKLPLGILPDVVYDEHTYGPLHPGQVIVVGTDGVWEMPNAANEQFGKGRLREVIRKVSKAIVLDGQLDECDLTFWDLERVQAAFLRTLVSTHHHRVDYPGFDFGRPRAAARG